jgi:Flp pilus assembly protein TadG
MGVKKSHLKRAIKRFGRAKKGVAALEFALIAFPFFVFLMGMAEVAMMGFAQTSLDFAVSETARRIRTGQVQAEGLTSDQMRGEMCDNLTWLLSTDCNAALHLDVDRFESFVDVNTNSPLSNGAFNQSQMSFNPGSPSDIILVRAYFQWQMMTPYFSQFFANMSTGQRLISSTMLFRNEPFPDPTS